MIQSLSRGIEILEFLTERKSAGCTEIAKALDVNKSTAFRLLETLLEHNIVEQDETTGKYRLGVGILHISESLLNNLDLVTIARPYLARLVECTQESAHLCILSNNKALIVDQVKSKEVIKVSATIGMAEAIHSSAVGKCLLAFRNEAQREKMLKKIELVPFTQRTIITMEGLLLELEKIRSAGYALDDEEVNIGVRCIAAPIYNYKGEVYSCIGISGPATRIGIDNINFYTQKVKEVAGMISHKLGYKG
jgi:DNA-binding IclR family transcriptional regulator